MFQSIAEELSRQILECVQDLGFQHLLPAKEEKDSFYALPWRLIDPPRNWGIAFILPPLAREKRLSSLCQHIGKSPNLPSVVAHVEVEGIYLNFYFEPRATILRMLSQIVSGDAFIKELQRLVLRERPAERVMIEFSQPNTHKEFHVGHLRNVLLGNALCNLYEFLGHPVVRANYYGDHGIHVAKTLWGFLKLYGGKILEGEEPASFLARVYTEVERKMRSLDGTDEGKAIEAEQLRILAEISDESSEIYKLWQNTRKIFIDEFHRIYEELGVSFHVEFFESEMEKKGRSIVAELLRKGVAKEETEGEYRGTIFVDFADYGAPELGKMVLIRSDGTSLYQTKELALAKEKFTRRFPSSDGSFGGVDASLYVVGSEQKLYFEQLFRILSAWGFAQAEKCRHIAYELVQLATGKMSSREGSVVSYRDFIAEAISRARKITEERGITKDKERVSRQVAMGAVKYAFLKVSPDKSILFDWDTALSLDGNSGPYIQYAYARARKLVVGFKPPEDVKSLLPAGYAPTTEEISLFRVLANLPETLRKSYEQHAPNLICNFIYELARAFTYFYDACPVLSSQDEIRVFRQTLVWCFIFVLKLCASDILGIELPLEM